MTDRKTKRRQIYRLPPCPAYDVEAMESWLSEQAEQGLFLIHDGFFAGVAAFAPGEPRPAKYRLEAAQKSTSMWAEDGGEPDPQQVALSEKYAWEYVAKRGDFYIYRSFDPGAREFNTDPQVQAIALRAVRKRQRGNAFTLLWWVIAYPLFFCCTRPLATIIWMQTWLFLLASAFIFWLVADQISALHALRKLTRRLQAGECLQTDKDWRKGARRYHGKRAFKLLLGMLLLGIFLQQWSASLLDEDKVQLDDYSGVIPFATMLDFAGDEDADYRMTMLGNGFNTIREWSDLLAPRCIDYAEQAAITLPDGRVLDGGYYVDYYQTKSPAIARLLAREFYHAASREENFTRIDTTQIAADCDRLYAYYDALRFPTVVIWKNCIVVRAFFYQTSQDDIIPLSEWVELLANSLADE